jgi:phosphopantetheinyl transferase (holo-ACP synthase)
MPLPDAAGVALAAACLSPAERVLMDKYRHPRRRAEFIMGRWSLKRALLERQANMLRICAAGARQNLGLPAAAQQIDILPDDAGRPLVGQGVGAGFGGDNIATRPASVSISHAAGWAAAACSDRPIGLDIVDSETEAALPGAQLWLADCPPAWRMRLSALLWGFRECLLKAGALPARTLWESGAVQFAPVHPAATVIANWPAAASLASLEISLGNRMIAGAFVPLNATVMLVIVLLPVPDM